MNTVFKAMRNFCSAQKCYLCLRYDLSPMSPGWTPFELVGPQGFEPRTKGL